MRQSQNDLDKLFKDKLGNAEITPPSKLWSQIESKLPSRKPYFFENKGIILTTVALLCGLLSVFTVQKIKSNRIAPLADGQIQYQQQHTVATKQKNTPPTVQTLEKNISGNHQTSHIKGYHQPSLTGTLERTSTSNNTALLADAGVSEISIQTVENVKELQDIEPEALEASDMIFETNSSQLPNKQEIFLTPSEDVAKLTGEYQSMSETSLNDMQTQGKVTLLNEESILHHPKEHFNTETLSLIQQQQVAFEEMTKDNIASQKMWKKNEIALEYIAGIDEVDPKTLKAIRNKMLFAATEYQKGFYFGPYMGVNNTWLLVSKKYPDKYYRVENVDYKWSFGKSYGVALGYDFNKHFGVMSEIGIGSEVNQTYIEKPIEGNKIERQVKLNYLDFPIYFKYKMQFGNRYDHKPIVFSVLAGPRFGTLRSSKSFQNGVEQPINQRVNNAEWGLAGGLETDFYLNKYCFITLGLRSSFGSNLANFPKMQGDDHKDPIAYRFGMFTRFNFRIPTGKH